MVEVAASVVVVVVRVAVVTIVVAVGGRVESVIVRAGPVGDDVGGAASEEEGELHEPNPT